MATWAELAAAEPDLAQAAERIFRAFTLAYLATVRADGGPRVHPVTITVHDGRLFVFLVHGTPKRSDLLRDPRYALHSFPSFPGGTVDSYVDDEVLLFGTARPIDDTDARPRSPRPTTTPSTSATSCSSWTSSGRSARPAATERRSTRAGEVERGPSGRCNYRRCAWCSPCCSSLP